MANFPDKAKVNSAITDHTKIDLGHQHITSIDFMQFQPSYIQEMIPGSKIDVKMDTFLRANPMPVPSYARGSMRHRGYFVPFRTIFRGFNDFITDTVHVPSDGSNGQIYSQVPYFTAGELLKAFVDGVDVGSLGPDDPDYFMYPTTSQSCDLVYKYNSATRYANYTIKGRQAIKIMESLGYKLLSLEENSKNTNLSAMPLLALAKVYADWYYPQQYSDLIEYRTIMSLLNYDTATHLVLSAADIEAILRFVLYVQFDSDFLVSAWDSPNQPAIGNHSDFKLINIDTAGSYFTNALDSYTEKGYVSNNSGNATVQNRVGGADAPFITPYISGSNNRNGAVTPISQYLLHQLHALTDYMKRHQLAGSKAFERFLLQYGKALPAEKLNRSIYLGAEVQNLKIGDVYSSADTDGANLGDYAGKAVSYGQGHFSYETDEFGYFIIVSSIVPASGYCQGIDRSILRQTKLDFFNAEFDNNGVEPVTAAEVYVPQNYVQGYSAGDLVNGVFGFLPRYYGYKKANDYLTGNFRLPSINGTFIAPGADVNAFNASGAWHTMRLFNSLDYPTINDIVHGIDFVNGGQNFEQWKRLFYDVPTEDNPAPPDNFNMIQNYEIAFYAPCKPLWDTYDFDYSAGDKKTLEVNGVKHN